MSHAGAHGSYLSLIVSAGVFTLVDFFFHFDGLQPAFEEAQQQAAAAGGHYASETQATPRVDVGDPPGRQAFKGNDHGANACEYAVVRDCAVAETRIGGMYFSKLCLRRQFLVANWSKLSWALLRNGSGASLWAL